ncbi:MAG: transposase [Sphaerochaetaceae bacterium]|nr:transposase [Sphaerochaetaceae bacterium]
MKSVRPYLQEAKDEIVGRYRQSGLFQKKFCERVDVPITAVTLRKWLKQAEAGRSGSVLQKTKHQSASDMNIVCYNVGSQSGSRSGARNGEGMSLEEMVVFQQQGREKCTCSD